MGLLNTRNFRRAKQLLEKNRHKVGDAVEMAGTQIDKVSKGKTSNVTSKASVISLVKASNRERSTLASIVARFSWV